MVYVMVRVATIACMTLLVLQVVQVESGRLLKEYSDMTAQTYPNEGFADANVLPVDTPAEGYNYNRVTTTDEEAQPIFAADLNTEQTPPYQFNAAEDEAPVEPLFDTAYATPDPVDNSASFYTTSDSTLADPTFQYGDSLALLDQSVGDDTQQAFTFDETTPTQP